MRNHAAAAASTLIALISTAESFISAPPSAGGGRGRNSAVAGATSGTCVARLPPARTSGPSSLAGCSRAIGNRRRSGSGVLSSQSEGRTSTSAGGAGGAGTATEGKRPPAGGGGAAAAGSRRRPAQRRKVGGGVSSVEGAIGRKHKDGVEELKDRLKREYTTYTSGAAWFSPRRRCQRLMLQ